MAKRAFLLGGTGQTGRALVPRLADHGWEVTVASRGERPVPPEIEKRARLVQLDREDGAGLRTAVGDGVDVLVDFVAFEASHADQLLELVGSVGSLIVLSSSSVYSDAQGRTLDEATGPHDFPELRVPVVETARTVAPGDATYSTKKVAIERRLLDQDLLAATVVRPAAIHGPGGSLSREWYFVKRALDRRRYVVLAGRGAGRFHTTSAENLAELIRLAAERPGTRVLNCADPDSPSVVEIARAISTAMDWEWTEVLLPDPPVDGKPGSTPWSVPKPFVLDMTEAEIVLGYTPVTTYESAVRATCEWLTKAMADRDWREVLQGSARYMEFDFDYEAEDELVAGLAVKDG
jgi:nucleoside-diphosphate-sugar epimerase